MTYKHVKDIKKAAVSAQGAGRKQRPRAKLSLIDHVTEQVRECARDRKGCLESMTALSRRFGVSRYTVWKAAQRLKNEGVICIDQGRRMRATPESSARSEPSAPLPRESACERVQRELRNRIASGAYRAGNPLPKLALLADELAASIKTVSSALYKLMAEDLLHKRGRRFIVGAGPAKRSILMREPYVILVITRSRNLLRSMWNSERTRPFFETLSREAAQSNFHLLPVYTNPRPMESGQFGEGNQTVTDLLSRLDYRYFGSILACDPHEIDQFEFLQTALLSFKKPVIWFDRFNKYPARQHANFIRCHIDEEAAAASVIELLGAFDHRAIAYPLRDVQDWRVNRLRLLKRFGKGHNPPITVVAFPPPRSYGGQPKPLSADMLSRWNKKSAGTSTWLLAQLAEHNTVAHTLLAPLCARGDITAILPSNYIDAEYMYHWLRFARADIPGRLSIIAFDNYALQNTFPISTVDFGFDYLGYQAFHAIVGDIPVKKSRAGHIPSKPVIHHRGSVSNAWRGM